MRGRKGNESSRDKLAAAMAKLNRGDDDELAAYAGPLSLEVKTTEKKKDMWQTQIVSCGSNAFGQGYFQDIMSTTFKALRFDNSSDSFDEIACGSTLSAARTCTGNLYIWGSGLPSGQIRIPSLIPLQNVLKVSCGASHIGVITEDRKVYTWGSGENGMLGHCNRTAVNAPKLVESLQEVSAFDISCGSYHTAVVGARAGDLSYIQLPQASPSSSSTHSIVERLRQEENCRFLTCGDLYTFGLAKAGQLGLGTDISKGFVSSPSLVQHFPENGYKVANVSCGMHHTVVLAVPVHSVRVFMTHVFTFGWGEHGRLGTGNEENQWAPRQVTFPTNFHALHISAGEPHTLAAGHVESYAWGSNSFGQLGIGNPTHTENAVSVLINSHRNQYALNHIHIFVFFCKINANFS